MDNPGARVHNALKFVASLRNLLQPVNRLSTDTLPLVAQVLIMIKDTAEDNEMKISVVPLPHVRRYWVSGSSRSPGVGNPCLLRNDPRFAQSASGHCPSKYIFQTAFGKGMILALSHPQTLPLQCNASPHNFSSFNHRDSRIGPPVPFAQTDIPRNQSRHCPSSPCTECSTFRKQTSR